MRILFAAVIVTFLSGAAMAQAPDISKVPPHPRLWIGGVESNPGRVDPAGFAGRATEYAAQVDAMAAARSVRERAMAALVRHDAALAAAVVDDLKTADVRNGSSLLDAALAFDWIAASLSDAERKEIARRIGDISPSSQGSFARRFNALDNNPLAARMGIGLAALAIADDDPRAVEYYKQAQALMEEFIRETGDGAAPDDMYGRGPYGGGWPEGYDYNRHGSRYAMIYFLGLRSATGMDVFTGSNFWKATQLFHIYEVLPNGYNVLPFQDNDWPHLMPHDREVMLVLSHEYRDPHARWFLNHVNTDKESTGAVFEFLYDEPKLPEHDYSDLPLAHYIPGTGMVFARSGWGKNDTYVAFCASDWYVYHQNDAQNVFAIYRNAPLAIKDGVYTGGVHGSLRQLLDPHHLILRRHRPRPQRKAVRAGRLPRGGQRRRPAHPAVAPQPRRPRHVARAGPQGRAAHARHRRLERLRDQRQLHVLRRRGGPRVHAGEGAVLLAAGALRIPELDPGLRPRHLRRPLVRQAVPYPRARGTDRQRE